MGLFWRLLAPKPLKSARRAMHPVSLLTPRPVRNVKRVAAKTINPIGALGDAVENQVVKTVRGGGKKRGQRTGGRQSSQVSGAGASMGPAADPYVPMSDAEERAYLGFKPLTLKSAKQGESLLLDTEDGPRAAVTVSDVLFPVAPRAEYDLPGDGQHLAAVQLTIENRGPGVFSYDPGYESKLIGVQGGEYRDWEADLPVPTFRDVVRLAPGDARTAYVCYAIDAADKPHKIEIVFGIDLKADIGQWEITETRPSAESMVIGQAESKPRALKFSDDPDEQARLEFAHALQTLPADEARSRALESLSNPDFDIRSRGLFFLEDLADPTLVGALRGRLSDPEAYLRQRAVRALKKIGTPDALEAIKPAVEDPDKSVRGEATRALGETTR
jgi:hypothetical protein